MRLWAGRSHKPLFDGDLGITRNDDGVGPPAFGKILRQILQQGLNFFLRHGGADIHRHMKIVPPSLYAIRAAGYRAELMTLYAVSLHCFFAIALRQGLLTTRRT